MAFYEIRTKQSTSYSITPVALMFWPHDIRQALALWCPKLFGRIAVITRGNLARFIARTISVMGHLRSRVNPLYPGEVGLKKERQTRDPSTTLSRWPELRCDALSRG
jgi:hypothetical protein